MKVGLVVDGESEYYALRAMTDRLSAAIGGSVLAPVRANIQPYAPPGQVVQACKSRLAQLELREVDAIVVLVDREAREECPSDLAERLRLGLQTCCLPPVTVVLKDRMFENWLVADPQALRAHPARFDPERVNGIERRVRGDRADRADALAMLSRAVGRSSSYDKVADSTQIVRSADPLRMAQNSRSFRRFLRVVGHPEYADQSARPVP